MTDSAQSAAIAALDLGDERIGVALTGPLGHAQPLLTIYRKTPRADLKSIGRILRRYAVAEIVLGHPVNMSGEAGPRARKSEQFAATLRAEFNLPVHLVDERLTTREAHELLNQAAGSAPKDAAARRERSRVIDQVAAAVLLQGFLDDRAHRAARAQPAAADAAPEDSG